MTHAAETTSNAGRFWAWLPAGLLGTMFVGLGTLAYIAIDDPKLERIARWHPQNQAVRADSEIPMADVFREG